MKNNSLVLLILSLLTLTGCGSLNNNVPRDFGSVTLPPVGAVDTSGLLVKGRAFIDVESSKPDQISQILNHFFAPSAFAASSGSTVVSYSNAQLTNFAIDAQGLAASGMSGDILSLGSVQLANIEDNKLKVCGPSGNSKCTTAVIRVYTVGTIEGFVNTADGYGVPVYAGSLSPTTAVGLLAAGAVNVQTVSIPSNRNKLTMSHFPNATYNVSSNFSNAGAGNYSMTFVVEYGLQ